MAMSEPAEPTPHVDETHGLWIPPRFREFDRQIVIRTPRATIQHFGSNATDPYYGLVDASHFGAVEEIPNPRNPDLAPNSVSLKPQGEEAVTFEVAADE